MRCSLGCIGSPAVNSDVQFFQACWKFPESLRGEQGDRWEILTTENSVYVRRKPLIAIWHRDSLANTSVPLAQGIRLSIAERLGLEDASVVISYCKQFPANGEDRIVVGSLDLNQCLSLPYEIAGIKPEKDSSNLNFYLKDPRVMQAFDVLLKGSPTDMPEPEGEAEVEADSTEAEAEPSASGAMALEADEHISYLKVSSISQLLELPSTLKSLTIIGCHYLESLQHVPIKKCINLSELCIIDCCSLKYFADHGWYPSSLTTLSVLDCGKLEFLLTVKKMPNLEYLFLGCCDSLKSFTLNLFPKLRFLTIWDCPNLESFSNFMDGRHNNNNLSLESLTIRRCPNLVSFPTEGLLSPSLKSLWLSDCENLRSLPNYMTTLTSLQSLFIERCPELESLPAGGLPSSLIFLSIAFCDKLTPQKEWNLHSLRCLSCFKLHGGCIGLKSFPEKDLLPINLNSLYISELPDLQVLDHIGLQHLTALQSQEINCCKKLWLFPKPLPPSLTSLCIKASSKLTPKLLNQQSDDWRKIAHISRIQIDDSVISSNNTGAPFVSNSWIPISTNTQRISYLSTIVGWTSELQKRKKCAGTGTTRC